MAPIPKTNTHYSKRAWSGDIVAGPPVANTSLVLRNAIPFDTEDGLRASCQSAIALHGELDEAQASAYWLEAVLRTVSACEKFHAEFTQVASANVVTL